jgi:hypothetical protein
MGFAVPLAVTPTARVRYWAWRMHSSSREVRLEARTRLMAIGRPAIDSVFPELVAGEVADRLASVPPGKRVAFVGRSEGLPEVIIVTSTKRWPHYVLEHSLALPPETNLIVPECEWPEHSLAARLAPERGKTERTLVIGEDASRGILIDPLLMVRLPASDPLGPEVIEATRARLAADK